MPDNEAPKVDIKVDVGFGAKAEIRTEIPAQSSGRLLDALTDMLRPISETRGLRADQIRLQREDVLLEIAKRTRERIDVESGDYLPVPNKVLIPALEKASLEDIQDSDMIDRWAELIASAARSEGIAPHIVGVLSELSSSQAQLLEDIFWKGNAGAGQSSQHAAAAAEVDSIFSKGPFDHRPPNRVSVREALGDISGITEQEKAFFYFCRSILPGPGCFFSMASISSGISDRVLPNRLIKSDREIDIAVLSNLSLLDRNPLSGPLGGGAFEYDIVIYTISDFGYYFLSKCSAPIRAYLHEREVEQQ